jgi:hypothetical protein
VCPNGATGLLGIEVWKKLEVGVLPSIQNNNGLVRECGEKGWWWWTKPD